MKKLKLQNLIMIALALLLSSQTWAQQNVSGQVTSDDGETLIGVSIIEDGTDNGTITDYDGKYELQVQPNAVLIFSYIGYEKQRIEVGNQSTIDVRLEKSAISLGEVIVVGYGHEPINALPQNKDPFRPVYQ